jgi:hypothetical protein
MEFKDLTGDKVFDYLKTKVIAPSKLVGARIIENKVVGPKEPRSIIQVLIDTKGKRGRFSYNYNKLKKMIEVGEIALIETPPSELNSSGG